MPSPFPGMNPFLEQEDAWHDFHERFLPLVADVLVPQVRPHYIVKIDEHVYVHELPEDTRRFLGRADVSLGRSDLPGAPDHAVGIIEAPAQIRLPAMDIERLAFVEVRDRRGRELVTVIDLLSPSNKRPGPDREQYLAKRATILGAGVHFVEIDLLRVGRPLPPADRPRSDYAVMVSRADRRPVADYWPVDLSDRLPIIPVPLRPNDPEARIDLQEILHRIYDAAGYEDYIYTARPDPELAPGDREWAESLIDAPR